MLNLKSENVYDVSNITTYVSLTKAVQLLNIRCENIV